MMATFCLLLNFYGNHKILASSGGPLEIRPLGSTKPMVWNLNLGTIYKI